MHLCDIKFVSDVLQARKEQGKGGVRSQLGLVFLRFWRREFSLVCTVCVGVCVCASSAVSELGTAHRLALPSLHCM